MNGMYHIKGLEKERIINCIANVYVLFDKKAI